MNFRVRGPAGQATITGVEGDLSVADFQALLQEKTGVPAELQEVLAGFPPKPLALPADVAAATVASLGLAAGDSLTVRQLPGAAAGNGASAVSPAPASAGAAASAAAPADADAGSAFGLAGMSEDEQLARAIAASLGEEPPAAAPRAAAPPPPRAAPAPPSRPGVATLSSLPGKGSPVFEPLPDGSAIARRIVADDNSCLFSAVGYVQRGTRSVAPALRAAVAEAVAADPFEWSEAVLGKEPGAYCAWIQQPKSWGGAIELSILSKRFGREIAAFDIQTQRVDLYGQGAGHAERMLLVYDGLHYDALALAAREGAPESSDTTVFPAAGARTEQVMAAAARLVAKAHAARQFTDTANFTLRCGVCKVGLKGEKEAVQHATVTGHQNFTEY